MNDSDSFFGAARPSGEESRPRAVNPRTGAEQSWQRASNYASPLDNPHGLIKWKMRELVKGLSLRPDLARMLLTGAVIEDNAKADELIEQAHNAMALDAKANNGTAVHAALSRSFLGHETPPEYLPHVQAFAAELRRNGLKPRCTEITLMNTQLGSLGHVDWIVETEDGRFLVLDVKTGKLGDAKRKFAVQCKVYAGADYMTGPDIADGKTFVPVPYRLDQNEAVLAHVDPDTGATALYRVDLRLGFYGAVLAENVRNWNKIEVLAPYVPVHHAVVGRIEVTEPRPASAAQALAPQRVSTQGTISRTEIESPAPTSRLATDPAYMDHAIASLQVASGAEPLSHMDDHPYPGDVEDTLRKPTEWVTHLGLSITIKADPEGVWCKPMPLTSFRSVYANEIAGSDPETQNQQDVETYATVQGQARMDAAAPVPDASALKAEFDALMAQHKTKPSMQQVASAQGLRDLAHNRAWLAYWVVASRHGATPAEAVTYAQNKGQISAKTQVTDVAKASPDEPRPSTEPERQAGDLSFIFKSIEGARSEGAIEALRANVVERRGDQAWTDEMATAARQRVAELIGADGNAVGPAERVLAKIKAATEQQHIAAAWSEVTIGGTVPENWTLTLDSAAQEQMAKIQAEQPAPPVNPYG